MGVWWWRLLFPALAGILLSPEHCSSQKAPRYTFMHDATSAQDISYYDYIIIGGGTAGCPLAATLSQNYSVLLLERGGSPYGNPNITNLAAFGDVFSDTSPTSPSQRFISQDGVINTRARVLGGGSCFNAGFYTRASPRYVREAGWDGKAVNESYKWVEKVVAFEPKVRQWQSAFRDGLLEVGVGPNNGFTYDHINGTKFGGTTFDQHGYRHFAADLLEYANPTGITVLLHATVNRILFRTKGVSRPSAYGVEFIDSSGRKHTAYLKHGPRNEIIVSAGALGSPQLLMLSGVGPAHHLQAHNISITLDQPLVGQGMADNPMNAIFVPSPIPVEVSLIQVVGITNFGSYIEASSGKNFLGGSLKDFEMLCPKDPKSIESMETLEDAAFRGGFILEKIEDPKSTGHLELRTRDPNENPVVTFNYFQDPRDLERCVQGISTVEKVIESKAFSPFRYKNMSAPVLLNLTASSLSPKDTNGTLSLEQFCRDTVLTIWHYHGGCQVGRVVDRDYKVLGVDALRVIDGSTFNHSPGTNPQATVMMLGRYMGVKILTERLAAPASDSSDNGNIVQENK